MDNEAFCRAAQEAICPELGPLTVEPPDALHDDWCVVDGNGSVNGTGDDEAATWLAARDDYTKRLFSLVATGQRCQNMLMRLVTTGAWSEGA